MFFLNSFPSGLNEKKNVFFSVNGKIKRVTNNEHDENVFSSKKWKNETNEKQQKI